MRITYIIRVAIRSIEGHASKVCTDFSRNIGSGIFWEQIYYRFCYMESKSDVFNWQHVESGMLLKLVLDHQDNSYTFEDVDGMRHKFYFSEVKMLPLYW